MEHDPYSMSAENSKQLQRAVHPKCPDCGSKLIAGTPVCIDAKGARQFLHCKKCWNKWNVDYAIRFIRG